MAFTRMKLTTFGSNLEAKARQGKGIHFTRIALGDGLLGNESMVNRTTLIHERLSVSIDGVTITNEGTQNAVVGTLDNRNMTEGFSYRELALVARDPDTRQEGVYLYDNAGPECEYLGLPEDGMIICEQLKILIKTEEGCQVTFDASGNPLYLTAEDIKLVVKIHEEDPKAHPNKADLDPETGKVVEEQLPTLDYADSKHAKNHAKTGNDPIAPADIGAAAASHTHTPAAIGAAAASHTHNYAGSGSAGGAATSAVKLSTARYIDGMPFNGTGDIIHYGTCATAAGTAAKAVTITGFKLVTGARVAIKFSAVNTAANPTLNVSGTGAKAIKMYGATAVNINAWMAGAVVDFVYDGTNWLMDTAMASRLAAARTIRTNLASTATASFDGSANITPGVTGILPVANGGTGTNSLAALLSTLQSNGMAKIATGSYVGTGTYGVNHPCSLTFPFVPKLVSLGGSAGAPYSHYNSHAWVNGTATNTLGIYNNNKVLDYISIVWNGNVVSWSSNTSANQQLNVSEATAARWQRKFFEEVARNRDLLD